MPPGAGFSETHQVFELGMMLQLGFLLVRQTPAFPLLDERFDARLGRFRRPKLDDVLRSGAARDELDYFLIGSFHDGNFTPLFRLALRLAPRRERPAPLPLPWLEHV